MKNMNVEIEAGLAAVAYELSAVTELMDTPEQARELGGDSLSGIRIIIEEAAEVLLDMAETEKQGYKLMATAALLEPERAKECSLDAFSGVRLIIEGVIKSLLSEPTEAPC